MVLTFVGVSSLFKSSIAAGEGFNPDINYKLNLDNEDGQVQATAALFQTTAATGTCLNPERCNDNSVLSEAQFDTNEYIEVTFPYIVRIQRIRHWGDNDNSGAGGTFSAQYWNTQTSAYVNWVTFTATSLDGWSSFTQGETVSTNKVKILCTLENSFNNRTDIREFEVIY